MDGTPNLEEMFRARVRELQGERRDDERRRSIADAQKRYAARSAELERNRTNAAADRARAADADLTARLRRVYLAENLDATESDFATALPGLKARFREARTMARLGGSGDPAY